MLVWLKEEGRVDQEKDPEEFMEEGPYCLGCRSDGKTRWCPDCRIRKCCTDDRGLENCSQCEDFPCDRLITWSKDNEATREALERLKGMD